MPTYRGPGDSVDNGTTIATAGDIAAALVSCQTAQTAAEAAQAAAETAQTGAETAETNASASASAAAASASAASSSATAAGTSASNAATSETNAAASASAASTSAGNAATSESNAAASASAASSSETNAAASESAAAASASASAASASAASTSETNAAASASAASTSASNAAASASAASASASAASTSESNAATSESNAAASYDAFDDRYLGSKASDPTLDNDGDPLLTGALYWNTTSSELKAYDGAAWQVAYVPSSTYVEKAGDTMTGNLTLSKGVPSLALLNTNAGTANQAYLYSGNNWCAWEQYDNSSNHRGELFFACNDVNDVISAGFTIKSRAGAVLNKLHVKEDGEVYTGSAGTSKVWHAGNDGSGSGLDADTVDGYHASESLVPSTVVARNSGNGIVVGDATFSRGDGTGAIFLADGTHYFYYDGTTYNLNAAQLKINGQVAWNSGNDGSGSGLDADKLDTYEASAFPRKAEAATITANWTFDSDTTLSNSTNKGSYYNTQLIFKQPNSTYVDYQDILWKDSANTIRGFIERETPAGLGDTGALQIGVRNAAGANKGRLTFNQVTGISFNTDGLAAPRIDGNAITTVADVTASIKKFDSQFTIIAGINDTFTLNESASFGFTIDKAYHKTDAGTITVAVKINGTNVTGLSALSLNTTQSSNTATGANTVSVGNRVTVVTSSNSGAENVSVVLQCTRT